jgi:hypothetical protein
MPWRHAGPRLNRADCQSYIIEPFFLEGKTSQSSHNQGVMGTVSPGVDTSPGDMQDTISKSEEVTRKRGRPFMSIKHGSVAVPIYKGRVRRWDC